MRAKMNDIKEILSARGLGDNRGVQQYIDSEVLRLSDPYVPMQQGNLKRSGTLGTKLGSGEVVYNAPYARYQYYGKVMVGRAPKRLTDRELTYHGAPKRGKLWFERMKADHRNAILTGARKIGGAK